MGMKIPVSYKDLTLRQFIEIKKIEKACRNKEQVKAALITHFTGKSIVTIPTDEWRKAIFRVDTLLESYHTIKVSAPKEAITVNGQKFYGLTDATKLCVNQATAIKDLCANGQSDLNINKIAGLIYYKVKAGKTHEFIDTEWEEIAELLLDATVGEVAPTVFFYARVSERLNPLLTAYLSLSQMTIEKELKEITAETPTEILKQVMVGTI